MSKRFQVDFHDPFIHSNGLETYPLTGDAVTVDGEQMVRMPHGSIIRDKGFHDTLADATRAAAGRIEEIGHRLLAQAERLRIDAASMEVQS